MAQGLQQLYASLIDYQKEYAENCDTNKLRQILDLTLKHLTNAQTQDTNDTVIHHDNGKTSTLTLRDLSAFVFHNEARLAKALGDVNAAFTATQKSIDCWESDQNRQLQAECYIRMNDRPAALQAIRRSIELNPDNIEAQQLLGDLMTDHLQLAYSYIQQYRKQTEGEFDPIKLRDTLGFASKHLADARAQNPNATITVVEDKEEKTFTLDQVSALALLFEASLEMATNPGRALVAIQKSINYYPKSSAYRLLAEIYVKRYKRPEALQAIKQALALDPNDFKAHEVSDKLNANPDIGMKAPLYTNTLLLGFTGLGLIIFSFYVMAKVGPIGVVVLLAGGACFLAQRWYEGREIEDKVRGWKRRQL